MTGWKKATRSLTSGACVEVARSGELVIVRDSKDPDGVMLAFTRKQWADGWPDAAPRFQPLEFTTEEVDAFCDGRVLGEFAYEDLPECGEVAASDEVVYEYALRHAEDDRPRAARHYSLIGARLALTAWTRVGIDMHVVRRPLHVGWEVVPE